MFSLHIKLVLCMCGDHRGQKRIWDSLKTELQMGLSAVMCLLHEQQMASTTKVSLYSTIYRILTGNAVEWMVCVMYLAAICFTKP